MSDRKFIVCSKLSGCHPGYLRLWWQDGARRKDAISGMWTTANAWTDRTEAAQNYPLEIAIDHVNILTNGAKRLGYNDYLYYVIDAETEAVVYTPL